MTRRRGKRTREFATFVIVCAALLALTVAKAMWDIGGWLAVSALMSGGTYMLGRRARPAKAPVRGRASANAAYGKGYRGGSLPREPVTEVDIASAYPAAMHSVKVREDTASALANLGWPRSTTGDAITAAMRHVTDTGQDMTAKNVISAVLHSAGTQRGLKP